MLAIITKEEFLAGWISGMVSISLGHPFDTIKVKQQVTKTSIFKIIGQTFKFFGIRGFYKGLGIPLISSGIINATFFGVYGNVLKILHNYQGVKSVKDDPYWVLNVWFAGLWGGFVQTCVGNPTELIKVKLQTRREYLLRLNVNKGLHPDELNQIIKAEYGIIRVVKDIYKQEGLKGFQRGFLLMLIRDTPSFGLYIYTYETLDIILTKYRMNENLKYCIAGSSAGIASWIFVIPFDVCKTKIQSDDPQHPKYFGMNDCLVKTYKTGGIMHLMKGTAMVFLRAIPLNASLFFTYKHLMQYFESIKYKEKK